MIETMSPRDNIITFPAQPCPHCGRTVEMAGSSDGTPIGPPTPGDFILCFYCQQPSVWIVECLGSGLRKTTPEELAEFAVEHGQIAEDLRKFHEKRGW